jgi:cell division protein FtsI/penicillin-binding protein 2
VLGVVALVRFAAISFRLWYLQVLTGGASLAKAPSNRARHVPIPAARGDIVDRSGAKLVTSKVAAVVEIVPRRLPHDPAPAFQRLARTLGDVPAAEIARRLAPDGRRVRRARRRGGGVVRPHLGAAIEDASGATVKTLHAGAARRVAIDPAVRAVTLDGVHRAAASKHGTSYDVFKGWPMKRYPVHGTR